MLGTGVSRSNRFVRAPSSEGGSNVPRPALSVWHLDVDADGCWARQARSAQKKYFRTVLSSYSSDLDVHVYGEIDNIPGKTCQDIISKLASYFVPKQIIFPVKQIPMVPW